MATPYTDIYERAIFKFQDNTLFQFTNEEKEQILEKYLTSAIVKFSSVCKIDLSNRKNGTFNETLDEECIEILALGITYYWLSAKALNVRLLRNNLSTKDFSTFSNANILKEINATKNSVQKEFFNAITNYSYRHGDLVNMEV